MPGLTTPPAVPFAGLGGVQFFVRSFPNGRVVQHFVARLPRGYWFEAHSEATGLYDTNIEHEEQWLTTTTGTNRWK